VAMQKKIFHNNLVVNVQFEEVNWDIRKNFSVSLLNFSKRIIADIYLDVKTMGLVYLGLGVWGRS
jgi:hypothetical protein